MEEPLLQLSLQHVYIIKKLCTVRPDVSCESWMSLININQQRVATSTEHAWVISVTVDGVYKASVSDVEAAHECCLVAL